MHRLLDDLAGESTRTNLHALIDQMAEEDMQKALVALQDIAEVLQKMGNAGTALVVTTALIGQALGGSDSP